MPLSPTTEGFRAAFRRPSVTLAEISWRWVTGATAAALFAFGLFEYLSTLPVTNGELLFLRTRQPYFVGEAIAHILRGSLNRVVLSGAVAGWLLACLWIVAASLGRIATVRALLDYFRRDVASNVSTKEAQGQETTDVPERSVFRALARINFLRIAVALAALLGFVGASILAGFASPEANPRPGIAFLLFLPLAALISLAWWLLNWLLSLAGMFAVRDAEDAVGAISASVAFCRERPGAVFAVTIWTGLAHLVVFVSATTAISMPLGFAAVVPWRLVVLVMALLMLVYFVLVDWLHMARLAGYVCIAEMPEALLAAAVLPTPSPSGSGEGANAGPPLQTRMDRDETILSDLPNLAVET